jgi:hypothetical protein
MQRRCRFYFDFCDGEVLDLHSFTSNAKNSQSTIDTCDRARTTDRRFTSKQNLHALQKAVDFLARGSDWHA